MISTFAKWGMYLSAGLVAAFTIPRTLHFIQHALPASDQLYAYFALGAFDLGIVVWTLYFIRGARSIPQFLIGAIMVVVSVVGVVTTLGADMVLNAEFNGVITSTNSDLSRIAIYACVGIFALNICAKIGITVTEPEILERIKNALAQAKIVEEYFKEIDARAPRLAKELADRRAGEWEERMSAMTDRGIEQERKARAVPAIEQPTPAHKAQSVPERIREAVMGKNGAAEADESPNASSQRSK